MRINKLILVLLFCPMLSFGQYDIAVDINGLTCDDELLLANHFGKKQYLKDTSVCENGTFHFRGEEKLKTGVYLVVLPRKTNFEIIVSENEDQTKYYFKADSGLDNSKTETKGSLENELFLKFNKWASSETKRAIALKGAINDKTPDEEVSKIRETLKKMGDGVANHRNQIAQEHPDLFVGKLYNSMKTVPIVDAPKELTDKEEIRKFKYMWIREHYWDNVDMSEDGLVRSPIFHVKLKEYFDKYSPPSSVDTAIVMTDILIARLEKAGSYEQYKYTLFFLTNYFQDSKYMCYDKALWHMAKNYYCAGKADWADTAYINKSCRESAKMEPTLCKNIAPDLSMPDSTFAKRITLSKIDKPVTIVVFWDIDCGHCKKEMPIISKLYDSLTNNNIEVYAVYTKGDFKGWKKRLAKEKFNFINVTNAFGEDNFRTNYNILTVPQIFVLDQEKRIRIKKIDAKNLPKAINFLLNEQGLLDKDGNQKSN